MNLRFLTATSVAALTAFAASGAFAATLTLASYNIKHGQGNDGVVDLARQAAVMASFNAQAIALQEVDIRNDRTDKVDEPLVLAAELSRLTGGDWRALEAPAIAYRGGHYGNAMLYDASALTLSGYVTLKLPGAPDGDGARSAAYATFEAEGVGAFQFIGTHWTHRDVETTPGSTIQLDSIGIVEAAIDKTVPAFFGGDFNASIRPEDNASQATMQTLVDAGWSIDSPVNQGGTMPGGSTAVIDYILSHGAGDLSVASSMVVVNADTEITSDHYPVVVSYETADAPVAPVPLPAGGALALAAFAALGMVARHRR
ncbi:MAG: endonuclease/exonuclease/phosphatase family protein [Pikeienuella sp.]